MVKIISSIMLLFTCLSAIAETQRPVLNNYKITQISLILGLILGVIFILAYLAKKFALHHKLATVELKIAGTIPITNKDKLILLKSRKATILLGVSPGRISYLCHLDTQETDCHEKFT